MAGAEVIGAAIGVLLLILVGYLVVGSTLTAADIVTTAQKDVTLQNEIRLRTEIAIDSPIPAGLPLGSQLRFKVKNTGSETIGDFAHWDVFVNTSTGYQRYNYDNSNPGNTPGLWIIENNPHILNPDKDVWICATIYDINPDKVLVSTANGVYTSVQF